MGTLLYVQASPRTGRSHSRKVADEFVRAYRQTHPADEIVTIDLFKADLPALDEETVQAKYDILHGRAFSAATAARWKAVEVVIDRFRTADKILFAVPMWNFSIPYRLKQYLDLITQPGYTFTVVPGEGYRGLVTGKPACAVYARGGEYAKGTPAEAFDRQTRDLEQALRFIGFTDLRSIVIEPTLAAEAVAAPREASALAVARDMAAAF